jgi:hypothetical protein
VYLHSPSSSAKIICSQARNLFALKALNLTSDLWNRATKLVSLKRSDSMQDIERLQQMIVEAVRYSQRVAAMGMPAAG